ncbi:alpha/beta-Hydrolases superfamily protein [Abeliophyllum distichum]|uniref:Alpha/beta-Hydrolases superfamily protein n=1 Tax=Abeliophyllum distichum TaxID=126358 RepID=A0ABD1Q5R9_9LAMI
MLILAVPKEGNGSRLSQNLNQFGFFPKLPNPNLKTSSSATAIVVAGWGKVVDWFLETVAVPKKGNGTQDESARALAYLIADANANEAVFARPDTVPNFSAQPRRQRK